MSLKENSNQQKLHKNKSRGNMNNNQNNNGGGGGNGGGGSGNGINGLSNSPIKSNSNTLLTNTQYINTKYHNNNNNNSNYYNSNNHSKSESSSPNQQQQRYSPKIRNSYSYSSTSPFKKNNQLSYSPDHKYRQIFTGNSSSLTNSNATATTNDQAVISTSPTNGVAVPNPFGGSKYRDPPPALSLPLPPVQWMQTDDKQQQQQQQIQMTPTTSTTTPTTTSATITAPTTIHASASFPTSTCSGDVVTRSMKSHDILQKLNHGFRLSTAVQA